MRNILVLPDGSQQSFAYPLNREVEVGTQLQIEMMDDSIHKVTVIKKEIKQEENTIYYYCEY